MKIDDRVLRHILDGLYYPSSPYEFSVLPADILGSVYERFLGKVVRLTPAHRAKIEEKPEVRKSGGVYYTPSYIVDYIVKMSLGELLKSHTPDTATKVRIVDPACGSGSFLLGAYQYLLDWHLEHYTRRQDPQQLSRGRNPPIFSGPRGEYRLTARKKKEILTNSIFGVDIDHQAIEVSKLSLLLKVLEGETEETINASLKLFHDRALPDLGRNLRHGNSLVGPDLRTTGQLELIGDEEMTEFDWHEAFPKVFEDGGFDVVLGNPPYLSYAGRQAIDIPERLRTYFARSYESGGWPTAHSLFLERAMKTISKRYVSFIVPDQVGHLAGYGEVRAIAARLGISEVRYWGEHVFKGVTTPALTVVVDKSHGDANSRVYSKDGSESSGVLRGDGAWSFSPSTQVLARLREKSFSLDALVSDCGIRTTDAKAQVVQLAAATGKFVPVLEGKRIQRYSCQPPVLGVRLDSRKTLHMPSEERFLRAAFVIRQTAAFPIVAPRLHATYFRNSLHALAEPSNGLHVNYLVGLLNSRLIRFFYMESVRESQQKAFPQVKLAALRNLPIRQVDLSDPWVKAMHDRIVALVSQALLNRSRVQEEKNPIRIEALEKAFALLDHEIDVAVFKLYQVSDEDIGWIEQRLAILLPGDVADPKSWRPEVSDPVTGPRRARARVPHEAERKRPAS